MSAGSAFFVVCSLVALVGAVSTVMARNPIRGAVGLLAAIVGIAGLFLKLNAEFLAAIQLIVYAGAVVVLFVFVIMLLGPDSGASLGSAKAKARLSRAIAGALLAALALTTFGLLLGTGSQPTRYAVARAGHGSVEAVGGAIFTRGLVPFELATGLLIVAVVGAIAVARSHSVKKPVKVSDSETRRLFHGPLHPRDTGRPIVKEGML